MYTLTHTHAHHLAGRQTCLQTHTCGHTHSTHWQVLWIHWNTDHGLAPGPPPPPTPQGIRIHCAPHRPTSSSSSSAPATGEDSARDGSTGTDSCPCAPQRWEAERKGGERTRQSRGRTCLPFGCFPAYSWFDTQLAQQPPERSPGQPDEAPGTRENL